MSSFPLCLIHNQQLCSETLQQSLVKRSGANQQPVAKERSLHLAPHFLPFAPGRWVIVSKPPAAMSGKSFQMGGGARPLTELKPATPAIFQHISKIWSDSASEGGYQITGIKTIHLIIRALITLIRCPTNPRFHKADERL